MATATKELEYIREMDGMARIKVIGVGGVARTLYLACSGNACHRSST